MKSLVFKSTSLYKIFDFAHLEDGRFVVLLQSSPENLVHLAEASINLQEELVRVSTMVKEDIEIRWFFMKFFTQDQFFQVIFKTPKNSQKHHINYFL